MRTVELWPRLRGQLKWALALVAFMFLTPVQAASADDTVADPGPVSITLTGGQLNMGSLDPVDVDEGGATLDGMIDENGNITVDAQNIDFPDIALPPIRIKEGCVNLPWVGQQCAINQNTHFIVKLSALQDATGHLDPATGVGTVDLSLRIDISNPSDSIRLGSGCHVAPINLSMSTGTSGGSPYNPATGEATVADNTYSVPGTSGCTIVSIGINGIVNGQVGLPSGSGNTAALGLQFDPAPQVPAVVEHDLTVNVSGDGSVSADPASQDGSYEEGTEVTLTASAGQDSNFLGWSGCPDVQGNGDCVVTMDEDVTVSAEFGLVVQPFELTTNHGVVTFGSFEDRTFIKPSNAGSLSGEWNTNTGVVNIPAAGVDIPSLTFSLPGAGSGSVSFNAHGTHLAGSWNPDAGHLMVRGPFRASVVLDNGEETLSCHTTTTMRFSTDRTEPYEGTRFSGGLEGEGAVVAAWDDQGGMRGDEGCGELDQFLVGPGGMWLSHDIETPPAPPVPVEMAELSAPTLVNSSGMEVATIDPSSSLICEAGVWENYSEITFAWFRDGAEFDNNKPNGTGKANYRAQVSDVGSDITCAQTARASGSTTWVMGTQSNATTVAGTEFDLEFTDGMVSFGQWTDLVIADGNPVIGPESSVKLAGVINDAGNVSVPADSVEFPVTEFDLGLGAGMGLTGTVTFAADSGLSGSWKDSNGQLVIKGPVTATVALESLEDGSLTCETTTSIRFSTDRTVPYHGQRFTAGLTGPGAIVGAWDDIPGLTGAAGCSDLDSFVEGPGGMILETEGAALGQ